MKLKTSFDGNFTRIIQRRAEEWAAVGRVAALIEVPLELAWWYYNEWGTAPHIITPNTAGALAFPGQDGQIVLRQLVNHPGTPAAHMVAEALPEIRKLLRSAIHDALVASGISPFDTKAALLETVMPEAKRLIVESIAQKLVGTGKSGTPKLQGQTAAEVFNEKSTIVDRT